MPLTEIYAPSSPMMALERSESLSLSHLSLQVRSEIPSLSHHFKSDLSPSQCLSVFHEEDQNGLVQRPFGGQVCRWIFFLVSVTSQAGKPTKPTEPNCFNHHRTERFCPSLGRCRFLISENRLIRFGEKNVGKPTEPDRFHP